MTATTTDAIHISNFGQFGKSIPCDLDGYTHTTIDGWLDAPVDHGPFSRLPREELRVWARGQARESRDAIQAANDAVSAWQQSNG